MGRRSRARQRAATAVAARPEPATPARDRRRHWVGLLNPFRLRHLTRSRARSGAIGFGLSAALFAVLGWSTGQASWFSSAVLLAVLALAWGATAVLLGRVDRSN